MQTHTQQSLRKCVRICDIWKTFIWLYIFKLKRFLTVVAIIFTNFWETYFISCLSKFTVDTTMVIDYLKIFSLLLRVWFVWTRTADYNVLSLTSSFHICLLPSRMTHSQFALSSRFCQWLAANWVLEGIGNTCFV